MAYAPAGTEQPAPSSRRNARSASSARECASGSLSAASNAVVSSSSSTHLERQRSLAHLRDEPLGVQPLARRGHFRPGARAPPRPRRPRRRRRDRPWRIVSPCCRAVPRRAGRVVAPTRAPDVEVNPSRPWRRDRGRRASGRSGRRRGRAAAARTKVRVRGGVELGRSFALCTATSASPRSTARLHLHREHSLAAESRRARRRVEGHPRSRWAPVPMSTPSNASRCCTYVAWMSASGERRVARRSVLIGRRDSAWPR